MFLKPLRWILSNVIGWHNFHDKNLQIVVQLFVVGTANSYHAADILTANPTNFCNTFYEIGWLVFIRWPGVLKGDRRKAWVIIPMRKGVHSLVCLVSLSLGSLKTCMPRALKKDAAKNLIQLEDTQWGLPHGRSHLWSWKSATSSARSGDGIFAKSLRRDTSRRSAQLWNSKNPEWRATSPNSHLSYVGSAIWAECPRKNWRGVSCCLHLRESGSKVDQETGGMIRSRTLLGPVLVWSQENHQNLQKTKRYFESS